MKIEQQPLPTRRSELIRRLNEAQRYDIAIVGGGATGLGVALDAAARGFRVVLVESHDFAKGTSSRATKLVHGGVRYLAQGNVSLVREALRERTTLLGNAPHLAQPLAFVMPSYNWWETPFYGAGLLLYSALAGKARLGPTQFLSRSRVLQELPAANPNGLCNGVKYWDGQFNDARLAISLARTAAREGALLVNYCSALDLLFDCGKVSGLICQDAETGRRFNLQSRCVVNATGVWVDELRMKDGAANPMDGRGPTKTVVAPSQGVHLVVDREYSPSDAGLMVPQTSDGRVLFAVPWLGKIILGTTDTPREDIPREPKPFKEEIEFILNESARYLRRAPQRQDVKSVWVGLRPLVKPLDDESDNTKSLSREHTILVSRSGLVTVTGGKWTTYRAMAEDVLQKCFDKGLLKHVNAGATAKLRLVGGEGEASNFKSLSEAPGLHSYGSEQRFVENLVQAGDSLDGRSDSDESSFGLTEAMVRFGARYEYARKVEDVLARRSRLLFLDATLASSLAQRVGEILQEETGVDPDIEAFADLCRQYLELPS